MSAGLTTVLIAITVERLPSGTFHSAAVASFLRGWELAGLPRVLAQDIRLVVATDKDLADLANKKALNELGEL